MGPPLALGLLRDDESRMDPVMATLFDAESKVRALFLSLGPLLKVDQNRGKVKLRKNTKYSVVRLLMQVTSHMVSQIMCLLFEEKCTSQTCVLLIC